VRVYLGSHLLPYELEKFCERRIGCPVVSDVRALVEAVVEATVVALAERRAGARPFERG